MPPVIGGSRGSAAPVVEAIRAAKSGASGMPDRAMTGPSADGGGGATSAANHNPAAWRAGGAGAGVAGADGPRVVRPLAGGAGAAGVRGDRGPAAGADGGGAAGADRPRPPPRAGPLPGRGAGWGGR